MILILDNTVFKNDLINGIGCITNLSFSVYRLSHKFEILKYSLRYSV